MKIILNKLNDVRSNEITRAQSTRKRKTEQKYGKEKCFFAYFIDCLIFDDVKIYWSGGEENSHKSRSSQ